MGNFKIIEPDSPHPDVLLHRDRNENGDEIVEIKAIGTIDGVGNMFATEQIIFQSEYTAREFIESYSEESAKSWCRRQKIKC